MTKLFPKGFLWGAAASAPQTEGGANLGGKSPSTWDVWFEKEPERFFNQVGPSNTSDVYHRYTEDAGHMKAMNLNSYRTSIAWTRLLPDGQTLNPEAVAYYRDYFQTLRDNGVEPVINLFHFDMPWWMMEKGGWENREIVDHFAYYADQAFQAFGDLVKKWATFNEPMVHIECGYLGDAHWPMVNDMKRAVQVGYHTLLAHFAAVKAFREGNYDGEIGTILNLSPVYPKDDAPENIEAKEIGEAIYIKSLLDPIVLGHFNPRLTAILKENDLMPNKEAHDNDYLNYRIDFLGVNYYQPVRVQHQPEGKRPIESRGDLVRGYNWPDKKMNPHRGWEIYEKGIYDIGMTIKNDYGNIPWFISENGMGVEGEEKFADADGIIQDDYRIEFIEGHLSWLHQAIEEGSNCFGYHLWTFVDCWSWLNAYKNRYGFYRIDLEQEGKRIPKQSSFWMADVIKNNALPK